MQNPWLREVRAITTLPGLVVYYVWTNHLTVYTLSHTDTLIINITARLDMHAQNYVDLMV